MPELDLFAVECGERAAMFAVLEDVGWWPIFDQFDLSGRCDG